ncbi:hypothetical protein BT69DRAFT_1340050 [Atractiella rhizophila]|nr:hypothetical protein BT69DRAFT_1340050 [Atractiella rhizophila]
MPRELPEMVQDLIRRMLEVDPKKRITMEGIRAHPWFTRRPPRVGPKYLEPPTPQEIERPIDRIEDIDVDILANLRVLWYNPPERVIVDALISKEKNWEKVFYFLLTKYRARNLENFNEEEDIGPRALEMETGTTSTTSRSSTQNRDGGQSKRTRISTIPEMPERPMSPPPPSQTATTAVIKPITISRPNSPHKLGRALPSPPGSPIKTGVPVIQLQEATPQKGSYVHKEREPTFVEVDPSTTPAPVIPIHIPHVEDAAMQRFFHDIVDQLQTMSVKTASVGSASPSLFGGSTTPSSMDSPMLGEGSACVGGNHSPAVGSGAGEKAVDNRFEDAEGDYSMVDVEALNAAKVKLPERPPLSARPTALHRTSTRTTSSNPSRQSSGSSVIGTRGGRGVSGQAPTTSVAMQNPGSLPLNLSPLLLASSSTSSIQQEGPKGILSPTKNEKRTTLGLAIQSVEVPRFDGSEKSGGLLKKRKAVPDTTNSPILSDPMSPRQSWFANLFNWKQLSYTLLSTDNISATRSECKKILTSFGVVVIVENSEGNAVLKCRVEEIVDSNSNSSVLKPVKFRVDFTSHNTVSPTLSGHPSPKLNEPKHITCLNMVMEKGAHSTFRAIYNRLKKEWELDTGRSPVIAQGFQPEAMMMV